MDLTVAALRFVATPFVFAGHLAWHEADPISDGAFAFDYLLDVDFAVTPLAEPAVEMLNAGLVDGLARFELGVRTSILPRTWPPASTSCTT